MRIRRRFTSTAARPRPLKARQVKSAKVDVALVCHRLPDATARKVIRLFHERHPEGKVVYIVHIYGEWPEVEADRYVVGADGPDALLRVIGETGPKAVA